MKKKLAIISTFDDLCGIASYTRRIVRQLEDIYDITVFDLDQFIFRATSKRISDLADKEVERICGLLPEFHAVNIQLEHGTIGSKPDEIMARLLKFCRAAPRLSITFHTIIHGKKAMDGIFPLIFKGKIKKSVNMFKTNLREGKLAEPLYKELRKLQRRKPVSVICHTRRDARSLSIVYGIENVYDHPLAYYSALEVDEIKKEASIGEDFPVLAKNLKTEDVLLGCFGFLGAYKGLGTAIDALKLLPANYKLAVFGGVHPNAIQKNELVNPYIDGVLKSIHAGEKAVAALASNDLQFTFNSIEEFQKIISLESQSDLSKRIFFMGSLTDDMFPKAMEACHIVLLPYVEVGQSASGPMSMAVDLGANIIASRTKAFMQFSRYHPQRFEMFDVGNYLQLSQLISSFNFDDSKQIVKKAGCGFTVETNIETYKKALFWEQV